MRYFKLLKISALALLFLAASPAYSQLTFNELHYDNSGVDMNEKIEIAGVAGTNMTGWSVLLYNAAAGTTYASITLDGTLGNTCTVSSVNIGFRVIDVVAEMGTGSFQNNPNSSMALVTPAGVCYQFLSYEGAGLLAINGACAGRTSTYIGAFEDGTGGTGGSIQRNSNNTWTTNATTNTFGACNTSQTIVFPVEFLRFDVKNKAEAVDLSWSTATERNNDYFSVERSADGRTYQSIGAVKGNGNSVTEIQYTFTDPKPLKGTNYYRLQQVDFDGKSNFSPVRTVKMGTPNTVVVAPNPLVEGTANTALFYESTSESELTILVYNTLGQLMIQKQTNIETGKNQINLDLSSLPKGIYALQCQSGTDLIETQQIIIK